MTQAPQRRLVRRVLSAFGFTAQNLDRNTWVLQRRGVRRRTVRQIGPARLRTHVLVDEVGIRGQMNGFQNRMGAYLGEEHLAWVLRRMQINCVLDVGANVGQFGTLLRRAGYTGRIVSFEPIEHLYRELEKTAAGDRSWLVVPSALGDEEGQVEINVVRGTMSSLLPTSSFAKQWKGRLRDSHPETITIRRLDSVFDEVTGGIETPRIFLKMDTQGYDLMALRGAGARLPEIVGLQSEVACVALYDGMPRLVEQLTAYEEAGFDISGIFPVSRHRKTLRAIEFDVIMVRPESVLT